MFQNISDENRQEEYEDVHFSDHKKEKKINLREMFSVPNMILYVVSFLVSIVPMGEGLAPFAIAMFAAVCSNKVPVGIVFVVCALGTLLGFGKSNFLIFVLMSLLFMALVLIFRPRIDEESRYQRNKVGLHLFFAVFLVNLCGLLFKTFLVYDFLVTVVLSMMACVFYKIFSSAIYVIQEFQEKKAFSIEEVMGTSLLFAIAIAAFGDTNIVGFSITRVLSIFIVLLLGWKNGILVGGTSGITIGVVLGILTKSDPLMIAAYAFSGMVGGAFNKLGKPGVIVGFILGNIILSYAAKGNTGAILYIREILVASLGLLLVPKSVHIDIEDLIGRTKLLKPPASTALEGNVDTVYKLNHMSETISEIAKSYKEAAVTTMESMDEQTNIEKENKRIFEEELLNNIEQLSSNILYDDIIDIENGIIDDIFEVVYEKSQIVEEDIVDIFEKHNNYIIGLDEENGENYIKEDLREIMKLINDTYTVSKLNFIWSQKMTESRKTLSNQLDGVSRVISDLAEDLAEKEEKRDEFEKQKEEIKILLEQKEIFLQEINIKKEKSGRLVIDLFVDACEDESMCKTDKIQKVLSKVFKKAIVLQKQKCGIDHETDLCRQTYATEDRFFIQIGAARTKKTDSPVSGDSSLQIKLDDGKYLLAISDGMGSGPKARKNSQIAVKMLKRLLTAGFDRDVSLGLINSTLSLSTNEEMYSTLDISILDLFKGNIEFIKNGACPTYLKNGNHVELIKSVSLPSGILDNVDLVVYDKDLEDGDIIVMCSDGIVESTDTYLEKEEWLKDLLEKISTDNVQKIADIILAEAIDNGIGIAKDDMTIMVAKVTKKCQ